ncbi:MAG: DNA alkylation repair protein [Candidatus Sericytochromatia bacterium]
MPIADHVFALAAALREAATPERAEHEKAYLKSDLTFFGASIPATRATARAFKRANPTMPPAERRALVAALWDTPVHELRGVGVALLELWVNELDPDADLPLVEACLRAAGTWAHVDWLAIKVAGPLLARRPDRVAVLDRWAADPDFWIRRSALLAELDALKAGGGDWATFERLASGMVGEREFFIRKAIGWVLREVSKQRPDLSYAFLERHARAASGLTMREGAKYLSPAQREALAQRRTSGSGRPTGA